MKKRNKNKPYSDRIGYYLYNYTKRGQKMIDIYNDEVAKEQMKKIRGQDKILKELIKSVNNDIKKYFEANYKYCETYEEFSDLDLWYADYWKNLYYNLCNSVKKYLKKAGCDIDDLMVEAYIILFEMIEELQEKYKEE
jgi:hypothetical protein